MRLALALYLALVAGSAAQPPAGEALPAPRALPHPNDALVLALQDLRALPDVDQPFIRYLWVTSGDAEDGKAVSLALNTVSRASVIVRPGPVVAGKLVLLRVDLRAYAPRAKDLAEWLDLWEDFQFDPRLNLLITRGTLAAAAAQFPALKAKGTVVRRELAEKMTYGAGDVGPPVVTKKLQRTVKREDVDLGKVKLDDIDLIRLNSPALDPDVLAELILRTQSQAPVVTDVYFVGRALAQIQDKGLFEVLYSGRYYKLAGLPATEDELLEQLGVGNVKAGVNAAKLFDQLRSDQRVAMFRSDVTGQPRRVDVLPTLSARGGGFYRVSHDLKADDIDIDTHPIANLIAFKDFAREALFTRANGLIGGAAIAAADGKLVDEVPFNVAIDRTIAAPHVARLQPFISCLACHAGEGSDGWRKTRNDVKTLLAGKRLDVFGDIDKTQLKLAVADTLDRLAGLYTGDHERVAQRGRDDFAAAVLRATGPMAAANAGQTDVAKVAAGRLTDLWRGYFFDLVTPALALKELGIEADPKEALDVLRKLLAPDQRARVGIFDVGQVIVPEDPRIAGLLAGLSITRYDWDLVLAFALERAGQARAAAAKEPK